MMPSVLVTGANGFIGSHLCDAFLAAGWDVCGLVRPSADLRFLGDRRVRLVRGDLTSLDTIEFPPALDVIVHAAALVSDNATAEQARTHVLGITAGLAEEARRRYAGLRRFIYISSALVLGYCADDIAENAPGRPASYVPYNRMKMRAEEHLLSLYRREGLPVVILRPGDVYGPRDRTSCEQMMQAAEKGVPLRVGSGKRHFGLCSPSNLCQAALAAAVRPAVVGKAYTVANAVSPTWREFFDALQKGVGKPQRVYVPVSLLMAAAFIVEIARWLAPALRPSINWYRIRRITSQTTYSISKTVQDLGYTPDNDYPALFESIVEWYRQEKARGMSATAAP
jgi:nucleoside-diphosphate-sugar epimerase